MSRPHRVLVVEDDETIRESVMDFLDDEGYAACSAANGREALTQLTSHAPLPSLILLDLMMPVMDGKSFRREQLSVPALASIPVIVLSALVDTADQAQEMNVAAHLKKPFTLSELLSLIQRHCGTPPRS